MERFNLSVVKRFWTIAKSYWTSEEKWQARGLLLLVVLMSLGYTGLSVLLNNKRGALISALSAQDEARFWQTILVFAGTLVVYAPLFAGYVYLRDRLGLQWRRWLTDRFVDRYFANRAFYNLSHSDADIDNPDQRIAEDVKSFTQESLTLLLAGVDSLLAIAAFSGVLWNISKPLIAFLVLYASIGTLTTVGVFGRSLVRLNFEQLRKEADFRFSLVRVRENAEAIAFYQGESREAEQVKGRFGEAFENFKRLIFWELNLNILTNAYEFIPFILPAIVVAPGIFAGELEVGKVSEAQGAFIRVFFSLNLIVARFQSLATFGAGVERLYTFAESIEPPTEGAQTVRQPDRPTIATEITEGLALQNLTLQTPNRKRTLIENLSVELPSGAGLLVKGPSGCGKSSLLRAIAGLWDAGSGKILRPPLERMLFLPQRPYMILGTLRDQLLYPNTDADVTEEQLREVLIRVNLPELEARQGGFHAERDWAEVLSLGEQQRLIFARLLLNTPTYAMLDEATSALDPTNEAHLYQQLQDSGITFLSVGHRESLDRYHQGILDFSTRQIKPVEGPESAEGQAETAIAEGAVTRI
ncbi:ABC transporter ATP-binding protein/permease [Altericista sp. CCNU0014]|uniref:ABC transporter ATP-binding protein/permease n=1 Tax=Altericista sp. CCNU0014 TaxID=3082949 RepID=UPI003850832F